jgi:hypothetical protein
MNWKKTIGKSYFGVPLFSGEEFVAITAELV